MSQMPNAKAIVFLSIAYSPLFGGTEMQVQRLAERWVKEGRTVWVLTRRVKGTPHQEHLNGVWVVRLPSIWLPGLSWITLGVSTFGFLLCHREAIGCLIGQMLNALTYPAVLFSALFRIPIFIRPSAGGADGNLRRMRASRFGAAKLSFFIRHSDYWIAINDEIRRELLELGVEPTAVQVITNGLETAEFDIAPVDVKRNRRKMMGFAPDQLIVLSVGRLEKVKNIEMFLTQWPAILRAVPTARWIIVGDGTERSPLEKIVAALGVGSSVRFVGFQKDTKAYYSIADLFVLPSLREGLSNALLEAMAMGVPSLVSDVGGNRDVLSNFAQLRLDPLDSSGWRERLSQLLLSLDERKLLSGEMRATVLERYSMEAISSQYLRLIERVSRPLYGQTFPILAYHRVNPTAPYEIDVSVKEFERQIRWLKKQGYETISLTAFDAIWKTGQLLPFKKIVITFDDGHDDFYEHAYPILKKAGYSATLFVNSNFLGTNQWVGGRRPGPVVWQATAPTPEESQSKKWRLYEFLSWEKVKELSRNGIEIASHGATHPFLTEVSDEALRYQLSGSKATLTRELGRSVDYFCYPAGDHDARVHQATEAAGYKGAVATQSHYLLKYRWENPYAWERIGIWRDVAFWKFRGLVSGWYPKVYRTIPRSFWSLLRAMYRMGR